MANVSFGYTLSSEEHGPADLVDNAARAEEAGFEFLSISDHFHPWISAQGHSPFVWSVLGAIALGSLATGFVYWTQHSYKLVTGGMPLFSFWATGVITYESTMLGAIVATFAWFLWESGLLRKRDRRAPVPALEPGSLCLRLRCRVEDSIRAMETMRQAGAVDIERWGES